MTSPNTSLRLRCVVGRLLISMVVCCLLRVYVISSERVLLCETSSNSLTLEYTLTTNGDFVGSLSLRMHIERTTSSTEMGTTYEVRVWHTKARWDKYSVTEKDGQVANASFVFAGSSLSTTPVEFENLPCAGHKLACCSLYLEFLHEKPADGVALCGNAKPGYQYGFVTVPLKHAQICKSLAFGPLIPSKL